MKNDLKILIRGAGDIASGIIWSLAYAGFNVCCTEVEKPSTIRTEVAFSTAIYDGKKILDGVECTFCEGSHSSPVRTVGASCTSAKEGSHSSPVRTVGASCTSAKEGSQFFIVTHSPILLGLPGAQILAFDKGQIRQCEYEETDSYRITKSFVNNREGMLKIILED